MLRTCRYRVVLASILAAVVLGLAGCPAPGQTVFFRDANLERAVRAALGQPFGLLTQNDLKQLRVLDAKGAGIRNLSGLEFCQNLTWLDLDSNQISNITPLANLTNLMVLNLNDNQILDISPLAGLLNLDSLSLAGNNVADLQALVTNAANGGLGQGDSVTVDEKNLSQNATTSQVPALTSMGVNVILGTQAK